MTDGERPTIKLDIPDDVDVSDGYHTFSELYDHRIELFLALGRLLNAVMPRGQVWRSLVHNDGSRFPGWFVMGLCTEVGKQITYHLPLARWEDAAFAAEQLTAPEFDGHTPSDVLARLKELI